MKNSFRAQLLAALILGLGISLALAPSALAAYNDVQFPQAADIYLSGFDRTLQVSALSNVNSITVDQTSVRVVLERDGGGVSSITFTSADRMTLNNTAGTAATCGVTSSSLTLDGPATVTTTTVDISPSVNPCSSLGGASSGSGVSVSAPAPSPSPSPTATPSPSPSSTVTPSPSPSPIATPTPTSTPTPTPTAPTPTALVPIPPVSAQPTVSEIQAAIAAIVNNIAFLQAELLKLQAPTAGAFSQDLFYGLWNNAEVKRLQEFLISKGYLAVGLATGNYYTKTVEAVKAYQAAKGISPANGRFGPKTRAAANADLGL